MSLSILVADEDEKNSCQRSNLMGNFLVEKLKENNSFIK
jgi:hypothetical protein